MGGFGISGGADLVFRIFPVFFSIMFVLIVGMFIAALVRSAKREHKNNRSPRLTVEATVVSKRMQVGSNMHRSDDMIQHNAYSKYYTTFQFASGDRLELPVSGTEYGMLIEGDHGMLSFQGTRYLGFERK